MTVNEYDQEIPQSYSTDHLKACEGVLFLNFGDTPLAMFWPNECLLRECRRKRDYYTLWGENRIIQGITIYFVSTVMGTM